MPTSSTSPPKTLKVVPNGMKLRRYQKEGVKRIVSQARTLLADEPGCLSGDTEISYNRAGITRKTTLAELWEKSVRKGRNAWNPEIPTKIKALCDGELRLHEVEAIVRSGVKLTYTLLLESGKSIRATEDHEFLTSDHTWKRLEDLVIGEILLTNGTPVCKECGTTENVTTYYRAKFIGVCRKCVYRTKRNSSFKRTDKGKTLPAGKHFDKNGYIVCSSPNHPRAQGVFSGRKSKTIKPVREHILVMEKHLGRYLTRGEHVHHIDGDRTNNQIENLQLVSASEHALIHPEKKKHLSRDKHGNEIVWVPKEDKIVSITPYKREPVYDIKMREPHHNFVANKIIVHNCGKTPQAIVASNIWRNPAIVIVCPACVTLNWEKEFRMWDIWWRDIFVVSRNKKYNNEKVVIVSYESQKKVFPFLKDLLATSSATKPSLLIADEFHYCLDEETLIATPQGETPLKILMEGDVVTSLSNNETRGNLITAILGGREEPWVTLHLSNGRKLHCLSSHRILDEHNNWKKAEGFAKGDHVLGLWTAENPSRILYSERTKISQNLFAFLWGYFTGKRSQRKNKETQTTANLFQNTWAPTVGNQISCSFRKNEEEQSNGQSYNQTESERDFVTNRTQTTDTGRKREGNSFGSEEASKVSQRSFYEHSGIKRVCSFWLGKIAELPSSLQTRCGAARFENLFRSRWSQPQQLQKQRTRQKEREVLNKIRVDYVEIQEFGHPNKAGYCPKRFVDLEVARDHNFFAEGICVHNCKNWEAQRTDNLLNKLLPQFHLFIGITGTPMTNKVPDLHPLVSACAPDLFPGFKTFCETYSHPVFDGYAVQYRGAKNITKLKRKLATFMIRRYKEDVLKDLPDKTYIEHNIEIDRKVAQQSLEYVSYVQKLLNNENPGELPYVEKEALASVRRELGIEKIPHVVEYSKMLLEGGSKPLVIFAYHREVVETLEAELAVAGFRVAKIYGGTSSTTKQNLVDKFQSGELDCLVLSIQAAGVGITLTASSTVVFAELSYVPADMQQAIDRIHRFGQKNACMIHFCLAEASLDSKIWATLLQKIKVINKVIGRT